MFISFITENWIEILGAILGLIYLYLEYKADTWLWIVGSIMPILYVYVFYKSKFYADMCIYAYYFFINVYGYIKWQYLDKNANGGTEVPISHAPSKMWFVITPIFLILWTAIYIILRRFTDSPVPLGDSFTTSLSIVTMWVLAQKYIEQWLLWIAVNIVSTYLYCSKGLYPSAIMMFVYSIVPVFGYFKWKRLMIMEKEQLSNDHKTASHNL